MPARETRRGRDGRRCGPPDASQDAIVLADSSIQGNGLELDK
jgi:hypothetical protein